MQNGVSGPSVFRPQCTPHSNGHALANATRRPDNGINRRDLRGIALHCARRGRPARPERPKLWDVAGDTCGEAGECKMNWIFIELHFAWNIQERVQKWYSHSPYIKPRVLQIYSQTTIVPVYGLFGKLFWVKANITHVLYDTAPLKRTKYVKCRCTGNDFTTMTEKRLITKKTECILHWKQLQLLQKTKVFFRFVEPCDSIFNFFAQCQNSK